MPPARGLRRPGDRKVTKLGKRTQSARLIHQFISLENGSLLAGRARQARQALASFRKFWLDRPERVERASQRPWWNFAICKMRPAFETTKNPLWHVRAPLWPYSLRVARTAGRLPNMSAFPDKRAEQLVPTITMFDGLDGVIFPLRVCLVAPTEA